MTFRLLVIMVLLIAFALWREATAYVDDSRFSDLSQMKQAATINGVSVRQSLSGELASGKDLLTYRLAPPPNWSAFSSPSLSSNISTTLMQSAGLTAPDSSSARASARSVSSDQTHVLRQTTR